MTIMNRRHERLAFPRDSLPGFWDFLRQNYANAEPRNWKYLAMLCLHEHSGWSLEQISLAFDHPKGHVSRCLQLVKQELRSRFRLPPGASVSDEGFSDPIHEVGE
jgi:hypothetical protein